MEAQGEDEHGVCRFDRGRGARRRRLLVTKKEETYSFRRGCRRRRREAEEMAEIVEVAGERDRGQSPLLEEMTKIKVVHL
jgi:ribosomal protein S6E (S10)